MTAKDNPHGQDDVDAIFGEIVAGLRADETGRFDTTPERRRAEPPPAEPTVAEPTSPEPTGSESGWRSGPGGWDETMLQSGSLDDIDSDDDDAHFVPPEPPPLPRPTRSMMVVGLFFLVGLILLIAPGLIGIGTSVATPLGMLSLGAGLGFLLLHAKDDPRPPPGSDPDTGAQV